MYKSLYISTYPLRRAYYFFSNSSSMEVLMQASTGTSFLHKPSKFTHNEKFLKNQISCLFSVKGCSSPRPFSTPKLSVEVKHRTLVIAEAKKNKNKKVDSHSFAVKPDEITGPFPEAVLLKEEKVQEDGSLALEFADADEEKLFEYLKLELESDLNEDRRKLEKGFHHIDPLKSWFDHHQQARHYEVVYLIHEDRVEELESVNSKIQDFLKEKNGKIWRVNDWGLRKLAYKIKKAWNAHYMLMNFELGAEWINDFKSMLEKDERVIRHMVMKRDEGISEDCPSPPELQEVREDWDDEDDDDWDDDEDWDDEDDEEEGDEEEDGDDEEEGDEEEDGDEEEGEDGNIVVEDEGDVEEDASKVSSKGKKRTYA